MWKYKERSWLPNVPARDITDEEYQKMDEETKRLIKESGLYELVNEKKKNPVQQLDKE